MRLTVHTVSDACADLNNTQASTYTELEESGLSRMLWEHKYVGSNPTLRTKTTHLCHFGSIWVNVECEQCGKTFQAKQRIDQKYCSEKCSQLSQRRVDRPTKKVGTLTFRKFLCFIGKTVWCCRQYH